MPCQAPTAALVLPERCALSWTVALGQWANDSMDLFTGDPLEISTDGLFWDVIVAVEGPLFTLTDPPWLSSTAGYPADGVFKALIE